MCGIAGDVAFRARPDADAVRRATRALAHRGPDAEGFFVEGPAALGHRRLSVLDLANGSQPLTRRGVTLVFNGEAYDHAALRDELRGRGHAFTTRSDTEVVLCAYLEWGEDFCVHVHGMFALALWDGRAQKLILARDRLGKKPLYYLARPGRCVFASELKGLVAHGLTQRSIDPEAVVQYLVCEYVPAPRSIYSDVAKLPAAHMLVVDGSGTSLRRYWDLPHAAEDGPDHAAEELRALLDAAVRRRLVADVPVGIFLSGGMDSAGVTALATRHARPVRTFSIGFREASFDESASARLVAERLGTEHCSRLFSADDCLTVLPAAVAQLDEPFADPSVLPTLLLSRFAREQVTVALSGDGGDELFAGYDPFLAHRPAALLARAPPSVRSVVSAALRLVPPSSRNMSLDFRLRQLLRGLEAPPSLRHATWLAAWLPGELTDLLRPELRALATPQVAFAQVLQEAARSGTKPGSIDEALHYYLTRYLADDILVKADRASMAASLELRAPFLDTTVVEFAARLPWRLKLSLTRRKLLLRRALEGLVPCEILGRPKKGFGIPVAAWLRGPLRPVAEEVFSQPALEESGIVEPARARAALRLHLERRADLRKPLWALLMFQLWYRAHGRPGGGGG